MKMLIPSDKKTEHMPGISKKLSISINYLLQSQLAMLNALHPFVKNYGFTMDCHLTMNANVSNIAQTCYFELRRLASIRRFLTITVTATHLSAFVLSGIDYCYTRMLGSTHDVTFRL